MSQLAPRTGIIADTYVPFRWKPALRPTFCSRTLEKKKKTKSLADARFLATLGNYFEIEGLDFIAGIIDRNLLV